MTWQEASQLPNEKLLEEYFKNKGTKVPIERNWRSRIKGTYSPEVDIAVGPFAIRSGNRLIKEFDDLVQTSEDLIDSYVHHSEENRSRFRWLRLGRLPKNHNSFLSNNASNANARCFMAIEIESKYTSLKHKLGSAINASALGRVGILVALDERVLGAFFRLSAYLDFLDEVKKPSFNTNNTIIVTKEQFNDTLKKSKSQHSID